MKLEVLEKGIIYTLFIPPCDIKEVAEKCGMDIFDEAMDKTFEDKMQIYLLKLERRDFLDTKCFTKMEQEYLVCPKCGKPCGIIHDLGLSSCCVMPIKDL